MSLETLREALHILLTGTAAALVVAGGWMAYRKSRRAARGEDAGRK